MTDPWVRKTMRPFDEIKWAANTQTTVPELLLHMERHYTDWMIEKDVDCVTDICGDDEEALRLVLAYAAERRNAPDFKPGSPGHNNHSRIGRQTSSSPSRFGPARCEWCQGSLGTNRRKTRRFCGATCQKRAKRVPGPVVSRT